MGELGAVMVRLAVVLTMVLGVIKIAWCADWTWWVVLWPVVAVGALYVCLTALVVCLIVARLIVNREVT